LRPDLYAILATDFALIHSLVCAIDSASRVYIVVEFGDTKGHRDIGFIFANLDAHGSNLLAHTLGNKLGTIAERAGQ
jgi:hypothetical protein